jgi:hypothetical protein
VTALLALFSSGACGGKSRTEPELDPIGGAFSTTAEGGAASGGGATLTGGIQGACSVDDECVAVLNTHTLPGNCFSPSAASQSEVRQDDCLVPWLPNPRCSLPPLNASCLPPDQPPVTHPCLPVPACAPIHCVAGKCAIDFVSACPAEPTAPDCETLRTEFVALLERARQCDPAEAPPHCNGNLADTCGCELPYDTSGALGQAVFCAFDAWRSAGCHIVDCDKTCIKPVASGAVCQPSPGATTGLCQYPAL